MIGSLRRRNFKLVTGLFYIIQGTRTFKENSELDGLNPMKLTIFPNGTIQLHTIDEEISPLLENGHWVKVYHKPIVRESFIGKLATILDLIVVDVDASQSASSTILISFIF